MQLHAVLQVSQDGRNWTVLDLDPPIPVALIIGWAFVKPVLVYAREAGDTDAIELKPRPSSRPPPHT